ncbi:MAG: inorganic phosphate transporter, partial [Candidatus Bathyarchaeia archaeon]
PVLGFIMCYLIIRLMTKITSRTQLSSTKNWLLALLLVSILQEFWQGANNVSNATAFLSAISESPIFSRFMGGLFLALGLLILGRRVIIAAGIRITRLPIGVAFVTQTVIVLINAVGTMYGLPLSGTHLSVGCLLGSGIAINSKIDYKMCLNVILYWFLTLPGAAFFSMIVHYLASLLFPM